MLNRKGFTLIELMIVLVIIGILAMIAIPKFSAIREKAVVAGMKSDLKNIQLAEEAFYTEGQVYSLDTSAATGIGFQVTKGNTLSLLLAGTAGWTAVITNPKSTKIEACASWGGVVTTPVAPAALTDGEGVPVCGAL